MFFKRTDEKVAVVTGATRGIGAAVARKLAELGMNLVITGRKTNELEELAREIGTRHDVRVTPLSFDLSDLDQCKRIVEESSELFSKTHVLVNNAGVGGGWGPIFEADASAWRHVIDTNLKGLFYMSRLLLPAIRRRRDGHIFNISSVSGRWAVRGSAAYSATKFAVSDLSKRLREELGSTGIRVTNIEPGLVETALPGRALLDGLIALQPEDVAASISWCLTGPKTLNVDNLVIMPTDQAVDLLHHRNGGKDAL